MEEDDAKRKEHLLLVRRLGVSTGVDRKPNLPDMFVAPGEDRLMTPEEACQRLDDGEFKGKGVSVGDMFTIDRAKYSRFRS